MQRERWADTNPTVVAYGTPAIDVKRPSRIASVGCRSGADSGPSLAMPVGPKIALLARFLLVEVGVIGGEGVEAPALNLKEPVGVADRGVSPHNDRR